MLRWPVSLSLALRIVGFYCLECEVNREQRPSMSRNLRYFSVCGSQRAPDMRKDAGSIQFCPKSTEIEFCKNDPCLLDPSFPTPQVVIIGAGMAGLSAAQRLSQCGIASYFVIEATDRPGGRIHSCWVGDAIAELGAQWIHGGSVANPIFTFACQEGLLQKPLHRFKSSKGTYLSSDGRAINPKTAETAYRTFRHVEQQAKMLFSLAGIINHGSLLQFLNLRIQQELECIPEVQRYDAARVMYGLTNEVREHFGEDLSLISANQYGSYIEISGGDVRIPLGYVGILAPLLRAIPKERIRYCKPVSNIRWGTVGTSSPRIVVKCCDGEEIPADYVICTVSLGVLKKQSDILFCPQLPVEKMQAIWKLGYGNLNKLYFEYERPFWVQHEGNMRFCWSMDELTDRAEWVRGLSRLEEMPGSNRILAGIVSGQQAIEMEQFSIEQLAEDITRLLRQFTGDPTLPYPNNILRSTWSCDEFFAGSTSYLGLDSTVKEQCELGSPLPGPCDPRTPVLLFAGEATAPGCHSSVHGARLSGLREADRIIQLTRHLCGPPKDEPIC